MSNPTFRVNLVEHINAGNHVCNVYIQIGVRAVLCFKVFTNQDGKPWIRGGLRFGEPLRTAMRRAILAAAGYGETAVRA